MSADNTVGTAPEDRMYVSADKMHEVKKILNLDILIQPIDRRKTWWLRKYS